MLTDRVISSSLVLEPEYRGNLTKEERQRVLRSATTQLATTFPVSRELVKLTIEPSRSGNFIQPSLQLNPCKIRTSAAGNHCMVIPSLDFNPCLRVVVLQPQYGFLSSITTADYLTIVVLLGELFGEDLNSASYRYITRTQRNKKKGSSSQWVLKVRLTYEQYATIVPAIGLFKKEALEKIEAYSFNLGIKFSSWLDTAGKIQADITTVA